MKGYDKKQATGGSCTSTPGNIVTNAKAPPQRKPAPTRLDSLGGSHKRGKQG